MQTALTRLFKGRHELYYALPENDLGLRSDELRDSDLTVTIKCSSHACSNSLEKAYRILDNSQFLIDELFLTTSSFISSSIELSLTLIDS